MDTYMPDCDWSMHLSPHIVPACIIIMFMKSFRVFNTLAIDQLWLDTDQEDYKFIEKDFKYSYDISNAAAALIKSGLKFKSPWTMHITIWHVAEYHIICQLVGI